MAAEQEKKNKILHLVMIPFSGVGLHGGFRGDAWFRHRINIFKNYTLKSLANQSNRDFAVWCSFRPEEKKNPLTDEIAKALTDVNIPFIFTFQGLMYWDDKFNSYGPRAMVRNFLMMLWDSWFGKKWINPLTLIKYTWEDKNRTLPKRLFSALKELEILRTDCGWVYLTRLDSDDMFHR
ncbi:MAG: hypothetical protein AAB875_00905, partial [Patescibacteria group bacterium]